MNKLADLLIPGDAAFPAASATDAPDLALSRLYDRLPAEELWVLFDDEQAPRVKDLKQLESELPELFFELRFALYFSYYEQPEVIKALRKLGHDYHQAPQPLGYTLDPFDERPGFDLPSVARGSYKPTQEIERIDVSTLPWFTETTGE
jgi:hypothetical protein